MHWCSQSTAQSIDEVISEVAASTNRRGSRMIRGQKQQWRAKEARLFLNQIFKGWKYSE